MLEHRNLCHCQGGPWQRAKKSRRKPTPNSLPRTRLRPMIWPNHRLPCSRVQTGAVNQPVNQCDGNSHNRRCNRPSNGTDKLCRALTLQFRAVRCHRHREENVQHEQSHSRCQDSEMQEMAHNFSKSNDSGVYRRDGTSTLFIPAAVALAIPVCVSSKTRHFSGATPIRRAASRYGSGAGLPFT